MTTSLGKNATIRGDIVTENIIDVIEIFHVSSEISLSEKKKYI